MKTGRDSVTKPRRKPKRSRQQTLLASPPLLSAASAPAQPFHPISVSRSHRLASPRAGPTVPFRRRCAPDAARPRAWSAPAARRAPRLRRRRRRPRQRGRQREQGWRRGDRARAASSTRRCSGRGRAAPSASASPAPFPKVYSPSSSTARLWARVLLVGPACHSVQCSVSFSGLRTPSRCG